ncbi:MAG: YdcF family protein [Hyphomicrobiaceae bacterium]
MGRPLKTIVGMGLIVALVAGLGFIAFANSVRRLSPGPAPLADAIVVLTGDEDRISTGMQLMADGRARRVLISGVNAATRVPAELKKYRQARHDIVRCCVDLGREALNTGGNADEARAWALAHGYRSLLVVTSSYHVPRSLIEFRRAMPGMQLAAYPVKPGRHIDVQAWWRHRPTARLLVSEYIKFLGATARLGLERVLRKVPAGSDVPVLPPSRREPDSSHRTVGAVK